MADKKKKVEEVQEEPQKESPQAGVSSFSLLDTPKLEVEEISEEEDKPVTSDQEEAAVAETPAEETEETQISEEPEKIPESDTQEAGEEAEKEALSSDEVKNWLKDIRPDTTKEVEKGGGPNFRIVFVFLAALLLIGAVVGGIIYYKSNVSKPEQEKETGEGQISLTPTPSVTPAPEAKIDFSKYSVNILNGSGVVGEAGKVAESLKDLKFKVVKTGNAESYDATTTSVRLKTEVPEEVYQRISEVLSKSYNVEKGKTALEKDSTYDIVITVGTKK